MPRYEYRVLPAPDRGKKAKGAKGTQGRFALALEELMNEMGAAGWEYQRTDTLPCQERVGLTGRQTTFQHMLVFRRELAGAEARESEVSGLLAPPETPRTAPMKDEAKDEVEARAEPAATPAPEPAEAEEPRDTITAARDAAAALSARQKEGKAPPLGPAKPGNPAAGKSGLAAE